MRPILFSVGDLHFYTFGVFICLAILISGITIEILAHREHIKTKSIFDTILYLALTGFIIARVAFFMFYPDQFSSWQEVIYFWQGGLVAYAGIIGASLFAILYFTLIQEDPWRWLDLAIIGLLIGWIIGKIGMAVNGPIELVNAVPPNYDGWQRQQLWEIMVVLAGLIIVYCIWRKKFLPQGIVYFIGLGILSGEMFILEFWNNREAVLGALSVSQVASAAIFIFCIVALFWLRDVMHPSILHKIKYHKSRRYNG